MPDYICIYRLQHNGKLYEIGETVTMSEAQAQAAIQAGTLEPAQSGERIEEPKPTQTREKKRPGRR